MSDTFEGTTTGTPRWIGISIVALLGALSAAVYVGYTRMTIFEQETRASLTKANEASTQRLVDQIKVNRSLQSDLAVVTKRLKVTQADLVAARKAADEKTAAVQQDLTAATTSIKTELATKASTDDTAKITTDVNGVKTDLDTTKTNLAMARSEMGNLIARNSGEIDQLRRLGERDIFEFTLSRKAKLSALGRIQVGLKDTDVKRNRYTMILLVDDKTFEKQNRSVNEPITFYATGFRSSLELVVNKVTKTTVSGYLSAPKAMPTDATR